MLTEFVYQKMNIDGSGEKLYRVYRVPSLSKFDYWISVTDVKCPVCNKGYIRWYESGYVPGYRICDKCKRHFLAKGNADNPTLIDTGRKG